MSAIWWYDMMITLVSIPDFLPRFFFRRGPYTVSISYSHEILRTGNALIKSIKISVVITACRGIVFLDRLG